MKSFSPYYLALHVETTGMNTDVTKSVAEGHKIVALAAAVCDKETFKEVDSKIIFFETDETDNYKIGYEYHGISVDFLNENGVDEETAIEEFISFVAEYFTLEYSIITMGQHGHAFVIPFIKQWLHQHEVYLKFSVCSLDVFSITVVSLDETNINELISIFGNVDELEQEQQRKEYKCLLKVKTYIEVFRRLKKIWNKTLE